MNRLSNTLLQKKICSIAHTRVTAGSVHHFCRPKMIKIMGVQGPSRVSSPVLKI